MKRLLKPNAEGKYIIRVELEYTIGTDIAASYNPIYSAEDINADIINEVMQDYDNFIDMLHDKLEQLGFEHLEPVRESNEEGSLSRYFTFCRKDQYETLTVEVIVFLRISDHRLPKHKGSNPVYDRHEARKLWQKKEINDNYAELNQEHPENISNLDLCVHVNDQMFTNLITAVNHVVNVLKRYFDI